MTETLSTKLEPVEVQHVKLRRGLLGYRRADVHGLLEDVTASFEEVWFERATLRQQVERLHAEVARNRERERFVGDRLRNAQKIAEDTVAEARETAERVLAKARKKADGLVIDAEREPQRLREEIRLLTTIESSLHERFRAFVSVADRVLKECVEGDVEGDAAPAGAAPPEAIPSGRGVGPAA
jgi:cell division septum initiation protein DivIVA